MILRYTSILLAFLSLATLETTSAAMVTQASRPEWLPLIDADGTEQARSGVAAGGKDQTPDDVQEMAKKKKKKKKAKKKKKPVSHAS